MELHNKFQQSNLPFRYSVDEVDRLLKQKYYATEIAKEIFEKNDPFDNLDNAIKCYIINNEKILDELYNDEEKTFHKEFIEKHNNDPIDSKKTTDGIIMWRNINEGKLINIIIFSEDQKEISSITIQGKSDKLAIEMAVYGGIDPENCYPGNRKYEWYLNCLLKAGFLQK